IHASEDIAAAREKAVRVIGKLRVLRLARAGNRGDTTPSRRSIGGGFAPTTRSSSSCARSGGARTSWARSLTVNPPALNLAAARLRHIAGTAWSTKRYLNIGLSADERGHHRAPVLSSCAKCRRARALAQPLGGGRFLPPYYPIDSAAN